MNFYSWFVSNNMLHNILDIIHLVSSSSLISINLQQMAIKLNDKTVISKSDLKDYPFLLL